MHDAGFLRAHHDDRVCPSTEAPVDPAFAETGTLDNKFVSVHSWQRAPTPTDFGCAVGLSQRELAATSGVKLPLISAIERGNREATAAVRHLLDPCLTVRPSQVLRVTRREVKDALAAVGGTNVRIVGSVATGQDEVGSDLDLVVEFPPHADIVTLLTLEDDLRALLTVPVDVIYARSSGNLRESTLDESVPL